MRPSEGTLQCSCDCFAPQYSTHMVSIQHRSLKATLGNRIVQIRMIEIKASVTFQNF